MSPGKILIVDDEPTISGMLQETLVKREYKVATANSGEEAVSCLRDSQFDLVITDLYMPDLNGMEILRTAKSADMDTGVIIITAHSSVETAVEAMRVGAYHYLIKGFSLDEIELTVEKFFNYHTLVKENKQLRSELGTHYGIKNIIGRSPAMRRVFETVKMVAPTDANVLIQGESGTGKELIARAIHQCSDRRERPFSTTNCAAIPHGLMESELFGHVKGSFTGAHRTTKGRFEHADGGTLLLDEISEIEPNLQVKLLRILQEKTFEKVGSPETMSVDVRIIAAANKNLKQEVEKGTFREDLYYRLNVVPIHVPSLRERKEDIPLLVDHFIETYVQKYSKSNKARIKSIGERALAQLMEHDWPGNVRELENTIERAVVMCNESRIEAKHLLLGLDTPGEESSRQENMPLPAGMTLREMEKRLILQTLTEQGGNRTWAADKLGISVRTLRNKLQEYRAAQPKSTGNSR